MIRYDAGTTNPALLNRLGDWRDHEAWVDFVTRYDPVIRSIMPPVPARRRHHRRALPAGLDRSGAANAIVPLRPREDVSRLARRLCQSRAIDLLRKKKADAVQSLEDQPAESLSQDAALDIRRRGRRRVGTPAAAPTGGGGSGRRAATGRGTDVAGVLEGRRPWDSPSVRLQKPRASSYYAAFAAQKRVGRMLREEGQRLLAERRVR